MNETIREINNTYSTFKADKLHSELRILDWISIRFAAMQANSNIRIGRNHLYWSIG